MSEQYHFSVCPLASGSKGNSYLIEAGDMCGLIDLGLRLPKLRERLSVVGKTPEDLSFVVVTHEHDDHVAGIPDLVKTCGTPVYAHRETARAMTRKFGLAASDRIEFADSGFTVGNVAFLPIRVPHDAVHPLGYKIRYDGRELTLATDLGAVPEAFLEEAKTSHTVVVESNHDLELLLRGRYPDYLKRRIVGQRGHLSNEMCSHTLKTLAEYGVERFILSHLSEENNLTELAYREAAAALSGSAAELYIAKQHEVTGVFEL